VVAAAIAPLVILRIRLKQWKSSSKATIRSGFIGAGDGG
jgi:hypothetical protein